MYKRQLLDRETNSGLGCAIVHIGQYGQVGLGVEGLARLKMGNRLLSGDVYKRQPPTFTLFTNGRLQPTYLRYVERGLRERFDLGPTPIKLRVRAKGANGGGGRRR